MALPPPDLHIPRSTNTVDVSIINSTATLDRLATWKLISPSNGKQKFFEGHEFPTLPCFSFLIQNRAQNRSIVFDLAIRKDWWNLSPRLVKAFEKDGLVLKVEKDVHDILEENGVDTAAVEAIVWSHSHIDHMGDPSTFGKGTALVVGEGFKDETPFGSVLESDTAGREVRVIKFDDAKLKVGRFGAVDYFGDGSFYLLDARGHTAGHLCGFARVTSNPDSFILMGGDGCHHAGEMRPSPYMPLPESIVLDPSTNEQYETAKFEKLLPGGDRTKPFYEPARFAHGLCAHHNVDEALEVIGKIQEVDAADNCMVVLAHDATLIGVADFFPKKANDFMKKGWTEKSRWTFLKDFESAV